MTDSSDRRPALTVMRLAIGERFSTFAKVHIADIRPGEVVVVCDDNHCYEPAEIEKRCEKIRAEYWNDMIQRQRKSVDKSC